MYVLGTSFLDGFGLRFDRVGNFWALFLKAQGPREPKRPPRALLGSILHGLGEVSGGV